MERWPYIGVLLAYSYVAVAHLVPSWLGRCGRWARPAIAIGAVVHLVTLVVGAVWSEYAPGFPEALSGLSLGIAVAYAGVVRERLVALGALLAPLSVVLLGTSLVVPHHQVSALATTGVDTPWLVIHVVLVIGGIAGFALSGAVGIVYLWARHRLKSKRGLGRLQRLPSLDLLDRAQFRAMLFGFVLLTLGVAAGGIWAAASPIASWALDPKVVFTVLIWLWYGVALQLRLVSGRRGRWTALFSIVGLGGLVFSLVGVNFLMSGFHGYGG